MGVYNVKDVIRLTRKSLGYTHEQLENICSAETLSRVENGHRNISNKNYIQLMQEFKRDSRRFRMKVPAHNYTLYENVIELCELISNREYRRADSMLAQIEKQKNIHGQEIQHHLERFRLLINYNLKRINNTEYLEKLIELAKNTINGYQYVYKKDIFLSNNELKLLCNIAMARFVNHDRDQALTELAILEKYANYRKEIDTENLLTYILILDNYCKCMEEMGRYQEGIILCEKGIKICKEFNLGKYIPLFMYNRIICLERWKLDHRERWSKEFEAECKNDLMTAYQLSRIYNQDCVSTYIQQHLSEFWHIDRF